MDLFLQFLEFRALCGIFSTFWFAPAEPYARCYEMGWIVVFSFLFTLLWLLSNIRLFVFIIVGCTIVPNY